MTTDLQALSADRFEVSTEASSLESSTIESAPPLSLKARESTIGHYEVIDDRDLHHRGSAHELTREPEILDGRQGISARMVVSYEQ